jgi:hypothetical protein
LASSLALSANPQPSADNLYGISIDGLRCDALALEFDLACWMAHFVAQWPPGSPVYDRHPETAMHSQVA